MLRTLFAAIGTVELLKPAALVSAAERLAMEEPGSAERRSGTLPAVRLEGVVLLFLASQRNRTYSTLKKLLGVVGVLALLAPRAFVDTASRIAYRDECTWRPWVYSATRFVGVLYVVVALRELRSKAD
jgi:hypothetical protein